MLWSPDGSKLLYRDSKNGTMDFYVAKGDGSGIQKITSSQRTLGPAVWSTDSLKLVFRDGTNAAGNASIYTVSGNKLDTLPALNFAPLFWSRDAQTIVGSQAVAGKPATLVMYSVAQNRFEPLETVGNPFDVLNEGKQILSVAGGSKVQAFDVAAKKTIDLVSAGPTTTVVPILAKTKKVIFYTTANTEADIYQIQLPK
jgi:hypothetical protein